MTANQNPQPLPQALYEAYGEIDKLREQLHDSQAGHEAARDALRAASQLQHPDLLQALAVVKDLIDDLEQHLKVAVGL